MNAENDKLTPIRFANRILSNIEERTSLNGLKYKYCFFFLRGANDPTVIDEVSAFYTDAIEEIILTGYRNLFGALPPGLMRSAPLISKAVGAEIRTVLDGSHRDSHLLGFCDDPRPDEYLPYLYRVSFSFYRAGGEDKIDIEARLLKRQDNGDFTICDEDQTETMTLN